MMCDEVHSSSCCSFVHGNDMSAIDRLVSTFDPMCCFDNDTLTTHNNTTLPTPQDTTLDTNNTITPSDNTTNSFNDVVLYADLTDITNLNHSDVFYDKNDDYGSLNECLNGVIYDTCSSSTLSDNNNSTPHASPSYEDFAHEGQVKKKGE